MERGELEEIRRRLTEASPGPWKAYVEGRDHLGGDTFIMVGPEDDPAADMYVTRDLTPASIADFDFIAHSRQDIARLLDEVERLRSNDSK